MAVLSTAGRNAACDAIVDLVDAGDESGQFVLQTTGAGTDLATITLNDPAFGAASTGVATLDTSGGLSATADDTGTAAEWLLQSVNSGTPTTVLSGDIGTGSEDLDIDNTSVTNGQTVNLNAITVTMPAGS
jgi:hypothetical protein